jgi:hypothetical protein
MLFNCSLLAQGATLLRPLLTLLDKFSLPQGHQGGLVAAQRLTQEIANYLSTDDLHLFGRLSFWTTVYFNRGQLLDTLLCNNVCSVQQFDAFLAVRSFARSE